MEVIVANKLPSPPEGFEWVVGGKGPGPAICLTNRQTGLLAFCFAASCLEDDRAMESIAEEVEAIKQRKEQRKALEKLVEEANRG